MTASEAELTGRSVFTDPNPLDVPEVIGVEEHRIYSGRPIGLRQRHGEVLRRLSVSFAAAEIRQRKEPPENRSALKIDRENCILLSGVSFSMRRSQPDQGRHHSWYQSEEDAAEDRFPRELPLRSDLERIVARGFYPNDLALLLPGQLDLDRGHALLDPVDDNRGAYRRRCHRDPLRASPGQRGAIRSQQGARESQEKKPSCVLSPHGPLAFAHKDISGQRKSCQGCVNFRAEARGGRGAGTPRRKEEAGKGGNWAS